MFGLVVLALLTAGDAAFWTLRHALYELPARAITVAVLVGLWLVRAYKRLDR
ncbi:hypothetical protein [Sphingobium sp. CCH11-B1]|jgi:hypothetical protein|uniref:hypothetical protein n=1 Tax=Sphingobium sp. CCH11-B1 TaxID=1768781 RepID=UPI0018D210EE|nr:hypothetical protein [Sphingobium sp. CCH11-B1]